MFIANVQSSFEIFSKLKTENTVVIFTKSFKIFILIDFSIKFSQGKNQAMS